MILPKYRSVSARTKLSTVTGMISFVIGGSGSPRATPQATTAMQLTSANLRLMIPPGHFNLPFFLAICDNVHFARKQKFILGWLLSLAKHTFGLIQERGVSTCLCVTQRSGGRVVPDNHD